jgi:hypothetical protein
VTSDFRQLRGSLETPTRDYAMPGITFVFGPNGSFFFDSPTAWKL